MRKYLLVFWLVILSFTMASAQTQNQLTFARVDVRLWPEFDRPEMLVIYNITLSAETKLPVEIQLRIPAVAGKPHAVASKQPGGSLFTLPFEQELSGDWSIIKFNATTPESQIEYYDPSLTKKNSHRHFEYQWTGDYPVETFYIQVQEPVGAEQMRFSPSLGPGQQAGDGMVYYSQDIGALSLGQSFSIVMDYEKGTDDLSADNVPLEASGPLDDTTPGRQTMLSALPWLLGLLGLLLILGGGLWYWQSGRKKNGTGRNLIPRRRKSTTTSAISGAETSHVYCHQCGTRAQKGDRFCRTCGTQLRLG
jgi:zinc-ribbon domain